MPCVFPRSRKLPTISCHMITGSKSGFFLAIARPWSPCRSIIDPLHCSNSESAAILLERVCQLNTCSGNPESRFVALGEAKKNRQFLSSTKDVVAYLDTGICVSADGLPKHREMLKVPSVNTGYTAVQCAVHTRET